ncbi:uncharacterized protein LOC135224944 [Macrobrachium nipponense]|uniref:uncharacterized protein LOC135224944 n=1 Tax=Macrobrachium nipponense TaxID=159736 RepID=UPI0030C7E249
MSNDRESTNRINYVLGPEGQTVVVVPPETITDENEEDSSTCIAWLIVLACFAITFYITGLIFAIVDSSVGYNIFVDVHRATITATHIFIGTAGFLTIVCLLGWKYVEMRKEESIRRLMYTYDTETELRRNQKMLRRTHLASGVLPGDTLYLR